MKQPLLLMVGSCSSSSPPKLSVFFFLGELWLSDEDLDRMKEIWVMIFGLWVFVW